MGWAKVDVDPHGVPADAGAGGTVARGVTANDPGAVPAAGSVLDQLGAGGSGLGHPDGADSVLGEVGGTRRTGSEIGNEFELGGTSRTGSETGKDPEPEARVSRRLGTASAVGGTTRSSENCSANGGATGADAAGTEGAGAGGGGAEGAGTGGAGTDSAGADAACSAGRGCV